MPFEYRPFVNPYVSSMSDLMGRGVEARSRAELSAAEAQAGAVGRLGDITAAKWSGLGDTVAGGIDAYVTEQREKPMREHALWQMEQDKIAAERAEVMAGREDVEWGVGVQEREDKATFGTLLSETQPRHIDADGNMDMEALAQDMTRQWGETGRDPAVLNEFNKTVQAEIAHDALIKQRTAQIEAAGADTDRVQALIEQGKREDQSYAAWQAIPDRTGPEALAAEDAHRLLTGAPTRGETPEQVRERVEAVAKIQAGARSSSPQIAAAIDNYTGAIRDFVQTGNRAPMHQAEQFLWSLGQNPGNVRANIVQGLDHEQMEIYKGLNPVQMGQRSGTPPESLFSGLPEVSGFGTPFTPSVAPSAPQQPGPWATEGEVRQADAIPDVITESQIREEVELMRAQQEEEGVLVDYTLEDGVLQALEANQTIVQENGAPSDWQQRALAAQQPGGRSAAIGAPPPGTPPQRVGQPGDVPRDRPRRPFFPPGRPFTGASQISPAGQGGLRRGVPPVDLGRRR